MSDTLSASGKCLCGKVSMSTGQMKAKFGACHCGMCRTWGGSAFMSVGCGSSLTIEGAEYITKFKSSDWANRAFCKECGTHLYYEFSQNKDHYVPIGFFEDTKKLNFSHQIFIDKADGKYSFKEETSMLTEEDVFARISTPETNQ
jgi:hypothetical protein